MKPSKFDVEHWNPSLQVDAFKALAECKGLNAATMAASSQLAAAVLYLDKTFGPRLTYNLVQRVADRLAAEQNVTDPNEAA